MKTKPTYRGELLPDLAKLTDAQIAERIKAAVMLDENIRNLLARHFEWVYEPRPKGSRFSKDEKGAHLAAIRSLGALLDIGLASIAMAEHRVEVQLFTLPVKAPRKAARRA